MPISFILFSEASEAVPNIDKTIKIFNTAFIRVCIGINYISIAIGLLTKNKDAVQLHKDIDPLDPEIPF